MVAVDGTTTNAFILPIGLTSINVNSSLDGYYVFNLTRLPPDVIDIVLTGFSSTLQVTPMNPLLSHSFVSGVTFGYSLTVPFIVSRVNAFTNFSFASSITSYVLRRAYVYDWFDNGYSVSREWIFSNETSRLADLILASPLTDNTRDLIAGLNTFILDSTRDGTYTFVITRKLPDFTAIDIIGQSETGIVTSFNLSNPLPPTSQLGVSPKFQPGVFTYTLEVAYIITKIYFVPIFGTAGSAHLDAGSESPSWPITSSTPTQTFDLPPPDANGVIDNTFHIVSILVRN